MADPISIMAIGGIGASALGGLVGAAGSMFQGQSQAAMYNYQAGVAQVNATLAQQDAAYAQAAGEVSAQQSGMQTRAEVGTAKAIYGAGNIDPTSGSAKAVTSSITQLGQQNEQIIRANAAKQAYGFTTTAAADVAQAGALKTAAGTSITAGDIGAVSSVLGGVGSVSTKWTQAQQAFGPTFLGGGSAPPNITG